MDNILELLMNGLIYPRTRVYNPPEEKKYCLECGKERKHNGGFCSAEHARIFKEKEKLNRRSLL